MGSRVWWIQSRPSSFTGLRGVGRGDSVRALSWHNPGQLGIQHFSLSEFCFDVITRSYCSFGTKMETQKFLLANRHGNHFGKWLWFQSHDFKRCIFQRLEPWAFGRISTGIAAPNKVTFCISLPVACTWQVMGQCTPCNGPRNCVYFSTELANLSWISHAVCSQTV